MFLRDKNDQVIKDSSQLVLLDIRGEYKEQYYDTLRVFKSQWFDLAEFVKLVEDG